MVPIMLIREWFITRIQASASRRSFKQAGSSSLRIGLVFLLCGALFTGGLTSCASAPQDKIAADASAQKNNQNTNVSDAGRPYRDPNVVIGGQGKYKASASADSSPQKQPIDPNIVSYGDFHDPLIGINRAIFSFNNASYRYVLIPVAKAYDSSLPKPIKQSVSNFFHNIKMPIYAINKLLQGEGKNAGISVLRFGINSTVGVLGLFDPAKNWLELERQNTGFGDTLASYKAGYGMYLVLPILGPSDIRTGTGTVVDIFTNPIPHIIDQPTASFVQGGDFVQQLAPSASRYTDLYDKSDDPYLFFRNLHLQGLIRDLRYE